MMDLIRARLDKLTQAERKVAEWVLAQPNRMPHAPVAEIARAAGVSQPTVIRFCRSMDCSGLQEFKLRLARSLVAGVPYVHSAVGMRDTPHDLLAKVFDNTVASLIRARNALNPSSIGEAIDVLAGARRIEFYGLGNSGIIAQDAQHKFFRLGVPCVAYSDPHVHGMSAALLGPGDVVVAISNSGRTADLLHSVELAGQAGATVIGITQSDSPLAERCHVALGTDVPEDPDLYPPMMTRIVHLVIIDTLAVGVALRRGPELIEQLQRIKADLRQRRLPHGNEAEASRPGSGTSLRVAGHRARKA